MKKAALLISALALAACSQEQMAAQQRRAMEARVEQARYLNSPEGQAAMVCEYQANAGLLARDSRRLFDLEGSFLAAKQVRDCMTIYRMTGRVP